MGCGFFSKEDKCNPGREAVERKHRVQLLDDELGSVSWHARNVRARVCVGSESQRETGKEQR